MRLTLLPLASRWLLGAGGLALCTDALLLLAHAYVHVGTLLPLCAGAGLIALAVFPQRVARWRRASRTRARIWSWGWTAVAAWLASVAAFCAMLFASPAAPQADADPPDVIIVLGSATPNGQPSPTLRARLELAAAEAHRAPAALVLVSGGVDFGERRSEADVMADDLLGRGIGAQRILRETASTSTETNLAFSRRVLTGHGIGPDAAVRIVTSDFHTWRALRIARKTGYARVSVAGAPTPLALRYNAWLREYFAAGLGLVRGEF